MQENKNKVNTLLKTCKGQVDAIIKMVEQDKYCTDILTQILAAQGLLKKVHMTILEDHLKHCVTKAIKEEQGDKQIEEVINILNKHYNV